MAKAMVFVDGTWLYYGARCLAKQSRDADYRINYAVLRGVLAQKVADQLDGTELEVIGRHVFGSYPVHVDPQDEEAAKDFMDFFGALEDQYDYEVEAFPTDFHGRRLNPDDRTALDDWLPMEKCVDVALAASVLYGAAVSAYDIAIVVVGDLDFKPVLPYVRLLHKQVAIASIRGYCPHELSNGRQNEWAKDFNIIWLNDILADIRFTPKQYRLECASALHSGDREFWSDYPPREGRRSFCPECCLKYRADEQRILALLRAGNAGSDPLTEPAVGSILRGCVRDKLVPQPGRPAYGFALCQDGRTYYFNEHSLQVGLEFSAVNVGDILDFEVRRMPADGEAGAAKNVRRPPG